MEGGCLRQLGQGASDRSAWCRLCQAFRQRDRRKGQVVSDRALGSGAGGIDSVKQFGIGALGQAKSVRGKLSGRFADRKLCRGDGDGESGDEEA